MRKLDKMGYEAYLEILPAMMETKPDGTFAFGAEVRYDWFRKAYQEDSQTASIKSTSNVSDNYVTANVQLLIDGEVVSEGYGTSFVDHPIMTELNYDRRDYSQRNAYICALDMALNQIGFSSNFLIAELKAHGTFKEVKEVPEKPMGDTSEIVRSENGVPAPGEENSTPTPTEATPVANVPEVPQSEEEEHIRLRKNENDILDDILNEKTFEVPENEAEPSGDAKKKDNDGYQKEGDVSPTEQTASESGTLKEDSATQNTEEPEKTLVTEEAKRDDAADDGKQTEPVEKQVENAPEESAKSSNNKMSSPNAPEKTKKTKKSLDSEIAGYVFSEGYCYKGKSVKYIIEHNPVKQISTFCNWILRCGKNEKDKEVCREVLTFIEETHAE